MNRLFSALDLMTSNDSNQVGAICCGSEFNFTIQKFLNHGSLRAGMLAHALCGKCATLAQGQW